MTVLKDIDNMSASGFDPSTIKEAEAYNKQWQYFLSSPIGEYLQHQASSEIEEASGGRLLSLEAIAEAVQNYAPDQPLFKLGFLTIWSSIGGNAVVYCPETKAFYFADHSIISGDPIVIFEENSRSLVEYPLTRENALKFLKRISDDSCSKFLADLQAGIYEKQLDELD